VAYIDFIEALHRSTKRDYLARVNADDKAACAEVATRFGADYWDGDRKFGYGGYRYDGRWLPVAEAMRDHYGLRPGMSVLDVGCGKGFLLHEFTRAVPGIAVRGIDISDYAIANAKEEVRGALAVGNATDLPFEDGSFDLVVALGTLHNLYNFELDRALREIQRVGRGAGYVMVESYRNEREKANLLYWQLTCRAFHTPQEWEWIFLQSGYTGDYGCIYFES
jgi:SAM-dependent methyltransferase